MIIGSYMELLKNQLLSVASFALILLIYGNFSADEFFANKMEWVKNIKL